MELNTTKTEIKDGVSHNLASHLVDDLESIS